MRRFFCTLPGKLLLYLLTIASLAVFGLSTAATAVMAEADFYTKSLPKLLYDYVSPTKSYFSAYEYELFEKLVRTGYELRYTAIAILVVSLLLAILSFVALMWASGRRAVISKDEEGNRTTAYELSPGPLYRMPFDLLLLLVFVAIGTMVAILADLTQDFYGDAVVALVSVFAVTLLSAALILGLFMSASARIKGKTLLKNTLLFKALLFGFEVIKKTLVLLLDILAKALGFVKSLLMGILSLIKQVPFVWRTALAFGVVTITEFLIIAATYRNIDETLCFWAIEKIALFPILIYFALSLKKLQKGGAALAAGDLSYQVDTKHMHWDLKRHGEYLNSIAGGMSRAVDHRMRSERMKTELITNVSHDIKTPLTSIINYTDLIAKEPCENEKIKEYTAVLTKQSDRLKRLIDDLVEASKAATGNLEVLLAPCDAGVALTQAAYEYEDKMKSAGLSLVLSSEENLRIMADGRRLWRIFDNLLNNICKYAQSGTRVYVDLTREDGEAVISFRNTSRDSLNISADELMERFVRGDESRSTEGNGLGLSIAKSLTELQNGTLNIGIDGDLFKAVLRFPAI